MHLIYIIISLLITDSDLKSISARYSNAPGIQWEIVSITKSDIFEEADTSIIKIIYNPVDTFYMNSESEKIIGIEDTIWAFSERHKQVQKKIMIDYSKPTDFVLNWDRNYLVDSIHFVEDQKKYFLAGKEGISPALVNLWIMANGRVKKIEYTDSSGSKISLTIKKEKLKRYTKSGIFDRTIPTGFKLIDLTE